jgi:UDP-galactopyranose mutase
LEEKHEKIENPANSEEVIVSQVECELYEKFFKWCMLKQWKRHPKNLDASVCGRMPIRPNKDYQYLREEFKAILKAGYTRLFEKMLQACGKKVKVILIIEILWSPSNTITWFIPAQSMHTVTIGLENFLIVL